MKGKSVKEQINKNITSIRFDPFKPELPLSYLRLILVITFPYEVAKKSTIISIEKRENVSFLSLARQAYSSTGESTTGPLLQLARQFENPLYSWLRLQM